MDEWIKLAPRNAGAYTNRAEIYHALGQDDAALADCAKAISLDPRSEMPYVEQSRIRLWLKQYDLALADCNEALKRNAKSARALGSESTHWEKWAYLDTLAAAFASTGDFEAATKYERQAINLAPMDARDDLNFQLRRYEDHLPYQQRR
ncbi:MAG TPA: tetratricopeptide repeat protein [Pirellulales bacterium]|nr:tetratricopeptide repeat protein [Pirellulales bacterium]